MGRLTREPELRTIESSDVKYLNFSIACDRDKKNKNGEREADFFNCTAWRGTAEFISNWFSKGSMIIVLGHLQSRSYEKEGERRTLTEVIVEDVWFGESKKSSGESHQQPTVPAIPSELPPDPYSKIDSLQQNFPGTVQFEDYHGDLPF